MLEFLVDIDPRHEDSAALMRFAFGLARQHGAHLTGLQVVMLSTTAMLAMPRPSGTS